METPLPVGALGIGIEWTPLKARVCDKSIVRWREVWFTYGNSAPALCLGAGACRSPVPVSLDLHSGHVNANLLRSCPEVPPSDLTRPPAGRHTRCGVHLRARATGAHPHGVGVAKVRERHSSVAARVAE